MVRIAARTRGVWDAEPCTTGRQQSEYPHRGVIMWRVLVVDDDFLNRKLILDILKGKAACDVAANGQEALTAYSHSVRKKKPYQAILLDVSMPEVDGMEVLKSIRADEAKRGIPLGTGIPIIMVTAHKEFFINSFSTGCDDYILKPFSPAALLAKVAEKVKR
jgi:two-component system chemotaxis response regulator CheY